MPDDVIPETVPSWLESPLVYCLIVPEELLIESDHGDPDELAGRLSTQIYPNKKCTILSTNEPRFVEAVDHTVNRIKAEGLVDVVVFERELGIFRIAVPIPTSADPESTRRWLTRHVRVLQFETE